MKNVITQTQVRELASSDLALQDLARMLELPRNANLTSVTLFSRGLVALHVHWEGVPFSESSESTWYLPVVGDEAGTRR